MQQVQSQFKHNNIYAVLIGNSGRSVAACSWQSVVMAPGCRCSVTVSGHSVRNSRAHSPVVSS